MLNKQYRLFNTRSSSIPTIPLNSVSASLPRNHHHSNTPQTSPSPIPSARSLHLGSRGQFKTFSHSTTDESFKSLLNPHQAPSHLHKLPDPNSPITPSHLLTPSDFLPSDHARLAQQLSDLRQTHELEKIQMRKQMETEIEAINKFFVEKIQYYESFIDHEVEKRMAAESGRIKKVLLGNYQKELKEIEGRKEAEIGFLKEQFLNRARSKENTERLDWKYNRRQSAQGDVEGKIQRVLEERNSEFSRKMQQHCQETLELRKENSALKQKIIEIQAKLEVASAKPASKLLASSSESLPRQSLYSKSDKKPAVYCENCEILIDSTNEFSNKIHKLKEFLSR